MLAYVTIGSNDLERSIAFYEAVLGELGAKRVSTGDRMILWSAGRGQPSLPASRVPTRFASAISVNVSPLAGSRGKTEPSAR